MLQRPYTYDKEEYYVDYDTNNVSFIRIALLLKEKGIEKWHFPLRLYDVDLVGVDVYDERIYRNEKLMIKVLHELHVNYYYFLREVCRIPEEGAATGIGGGVPFSAHRANIAQAWCFEHNLSHYLETPRQFGKTTGAYVRYLWEFSWGTTSSTVIFMNMDKTASVANLERLKNSRDLLPEFLQMNFIVDDKGNLKKDTENINEIKSKLKNKIITKASARNIPNAERVGRGLSVPSLWFDEFAFMLFNSTIYAAAIPAFSKSSDNAKENGKPYAICITSTPGDLGTDHGTYAFNLKERAARFTEDVYNYDQDEIDEWMKKNSQNQLVYISFSYIQLGKDVEWYNLQCERLNHDWLKIQRELLLQWNKASSKSPFNPDDVDRLVSAKKEPIATLKIHKYYEVWLYKQLDPAKRYIVGADVSKGVGRDATAVAIVDSETLECVGLFVNNVIRSREFRRFLETLMLDHLPNSILVIENNHLGSAIIEELKATAVKPMLYYEFRKPQGRDKARDGIRIPKLKNDIIWGHEVTGATRPRMMDLLLQFVAKYQDKIRANLLVEQIRHLEYKNEERIDHVNGKHDDAIFAYLACVYTMFYGGNLPRFGLFNRFNFDGESIDETEYVEDDSFKKLYDKLRIDSHIRANPYLSPLFEKCVTIRDLDKDIDDRIYEILNDESTSPLFMKNNEGSELAVFRPGMLSKLNNRGRGPRSDCDAMGMFGLDSDGYRGRGW